jgi:protoporphyrinogen oxidase
MTATQPKIAVLGAGPMGLAAAYQLAMDGHHPVLFEADDRVGGMTASFDFGGLEIERYYHFHCISDDAFLKILDELGLADKMHWTETKMSYWYQGRLQPWGNPVALLTFRGLGPIAKFRYGLHAFFSTKRKKENWQPLDNVEATSWVKRWVGNKTYELMWRKLFDYKFYDYATGLSAAWIWSRIRRLGCSRYSLFREKLGYLEGGSNTLLCAMKAAIEAKGGKVKLSSPVNKVLLESGKVRGIEVNGQFEPFDKVIGTLPLPYIPELIPALPQELRSQFQALKNIAVVCIIVKLRKALSNSFWLNTNDAEMDIPGLVEYTNLRPLQHSIVYVPYYMPGEHPKFAEPDEVFFDKVKRYFKKINPRLSDEDFIELRAHRYRYAQPICDPGYLSRLPPVALPIKGLWVADTSYYYPEDRGISESIAFGRKIAQEAAA